MKMVRNFTAFSASMDWVLITYMVISSSTLVLMQDQLSDLLSKRAAVDLSETRPVAMTNSGPVRGVKEDGIHVFKGIPYAEPPINDRRWKPPVPMGKTTGTIDASSFGSKCVQPLTPANYSTSVGSEDCLFLNVWAPIPVSGALPLPVIVWIHGGGLAFGSGNDPGYSPTADLVTNMGVVFVSMNYRLGAFGFLSLDLLDTQSDNGTSGNYGYMDQIQALKWVQTNIGNFGGNRNKGEDGIGNGSVTDPFPSKLRPTSYVTVLGHSAGGTSVIALLSSPLARGLFHGAWIMSPAPLIHKTAVEAKIDNKIFLIRSGCHTMSCLRGLSPSQVFDSTPWFVPPTWTLKDSFDLPVKEVFNGGLAIVDGYVLRESPLDTWRDGKANSVPVVFGTTGQELDLYNINADIANWTWNEFRSHVKQKLDSFSPDITRTALLLYPESPIVTPELQYTSMASDIHVTCPTDIVADVADSYFNAYAYRYVVTQIPSTPVVIPPLGAVRYAFHGWDAYAFFGSLSGMMGKLQRSDLEFVVNIRQEVKRFVETGRPKSTDWMPFKINTALLGGNTTVISFYNKPRCSFWMKNRFFPYAWVD